MSAAAPPADAWAEEDVSIGRIESELARLREASAREGEAPHLRTSVMTHLAWVPEPWVDVATRTLAGMAERHPSRTILLFPQPDAPEDRIDARLSLQCFPLAGGRRIACAEVIELRLRGERALAPASIVAPLLIADLPVFLRWRGQPAFGSAELEQLVGAADRLVVDSSEWPDLPETYERLAELFGRTAVSDIAWARGSGWRRQLAELWPGIAGVSELRVAGPEADALLLAGWLRAGLERPVELAHEAADMLERVAVDGEEVAPPPGERPGPSDLLSGELDRFAREPLYERAVGAAPGT